MFNEAQIRDFKQPIAFFFALGLIKGALCLRGEIWVNES